MRTLRELWKLSNVVYKEMIFRTLTIQQSYSPTDPESVKKLTGKTGLVMFLNKLIMFIMVVALVASPILLIYSYTLMNISLELKRIFITFIFLSTLLLDVFLLFFIVTVQISVLLTPDLYRPLLMLNFDDREISVMTLLAFVRILDVYVLGSLILTVIAFTYIGKFLVGILLAVFLGATHIITLWLITTLSKNYLRFTAPELSSTRMVLKIFIVIGYTSIFAMPYLISFLINNILPLIVDFFLSLPRPYMTAFLYLPPISATYLMAMLYTGSIKLKLLLYLSIPSIFYLIASWICLKKTIKTIMEIPYSSRFAVTVREHISRGFTVKKFILGLVIKDFKLLIRQVNYAMMLFLGPVLFGLYAVMYYVCEQPLTMPIGMTYMVILVLFAGAVNMLGAEGRATDFLLSLPVSLRDLVKSKAIIATISYVIFGISASIVFTFILKSQMMFSFAIISNIAGFFAGSYIIIRKTVEYTMESGELPTNLVKNIEFIIYAIGISLIYGILPLIIAQVGTLVLTQKLVVLPIILALQGAYFITYKISK